MLVEVEFSSRFSILEAYHSVGQMILSYPETQRQDLINTLSYHTGKNKKTFSYMAKFAKLFPKLDSTFNEGKSTGWQQVVDKYLREPKDEKDHEHEAVSVCRICRKRLI